MKQVRYPIDEPIYPNLKIKFRDQKSLIDAMQNYRKYLDQRLTLTDILIKEKGIGIKPEYLSRIPSAFSHIHEYLYPNLQHYQRYENEIDSAKNDLDLLRGNVLLIKSLAGHGKTNLLCDFAENFLSKKGHKCLYISARALNHLGEQEALEQAITRTIFLESEFQFSDILRLAKFDKKTDFFFILIDGINEHKNSLLFSTALEQFIQRCNNHNVKAILSCRSEYFNERFGNLPNVCHCSVLDMDEQKYINKTPSVHIENLLAKYFSDFSIKLSIDNIDPDIMKRFNEDKLLLRIFCETYENERPGDYLSDLYKLEIFYKYFEKKKENIQGLENCLNEIITKMIMANQFENIEISNLSAETISVIENTVYENVILKKDIILNPGLAFGKSEVINFVYDEFRDFLIASQLIIKWDINNQISKNMIKTFTTKKSVVAEGLQRYLCLWAIKNKKNDFLNYLSCQEWFDLVYIDSVFGTPDSLLSGFFIDLIKSLFEKNSANSLQIILNLFRRTNTDEYQTLNIEMLFNYLDKITDEARYKELIIGALTQEYDYETTYITKMCFLVVESFREKRVSNASRKNIIKLLGYLAGVVDYKYYRVRNFEFGKNPASGALLIIAKEIGENLVIKALDEVIASVKLQTIRGALLSLPLYRY